MPRALARKTALTGPASIVNSSPMHIPPRRAIMLALMLPFFLAACGNWERVDRTPIEPLRYDHLIKLRLNVAVVHVEEHFVSSGRGVVSASAHPPLIEALRQMAQDRLLAAGTTGHAVLIIKRADILQTGRSLDGQMDVELALFGPNTIRVAYAEAQVYRRQGNASTAREALHEMTRQMMDAINVELEFQARRNLRDWLLPADAPRAPADTIPAPVDRQELLPPRR